MSARLQMAAAVFLLLLPIAFLGCSDDGTTVPSGDGASLTGLARGEIDESLGSFDIRTNLGPDPERPLPGPFLIMGRNIAWVDSVTALRADILVQNISGNTYAEPVTLTFTSLIPDSVRVTDGDGVKLEMITFEFENDDNMWTDGETSFPETIYFGNIEQGQSVGFTARIDVGMMPGKGSIGGLVWDDKNGDGVRDDDEMGLAGVGIALGSEGMNPMRTRSGRDGTYRFDGLEAGFYTVRKLPDERLRPTTPTEIQVILQEDGEGGVSSLFEADFGCYVVDRPEPKPPLVEVGDCVHATGMLAEDPYRLLAFEIDVEGDDWRDDYHKDGDDRGDGEWDDDDDCEFGELRGPVTGLNREEGMIAVLGTWVMLKEDPSIDPMKDGDHEHDPEHPCRELTLENVEIGDRVRVRTMSASDPGDEEPLVGYRLRCWNGRWDKVKGIVDAVETTEEGQVVSFTVLRTKVVPMRKEMMNP